MRSADPAHMHRYLAIYFTTCLIPGLTPLGLAWMVDHHPQLAMQLVMLVAAIVAIGFFYPVREHD
jgi:hypothetical protein